MSALIPITPAHLHAGTNPEQRILRSTDQTAIAISALVKISNRWQAEMRQVVANFLLSFRSFSVRISSFSRFGRRAIAGPMSVYSPFIRHREAARAVG